MSAVDVRQCHWMDAAVHGPHAWGVSIDAVWIDYQCPGLAPNPVTGEPKLDESFALLMDLRKRVDLLEGMVIPADATRRRATALAAAVEALKGTFSADDPAVVVRFATTYEAYLRDGSAPAPLAAAHIVHMRDPGNVSPSGKSLCVCGDLWPCSVVMAHEATQVTAREGGAPTP